MRGFDILQIEHIVGQTERHRRCQVWHRIRNALDQAGHMHLRRVEAYRAQPGGYSFRVLQAEDPG
ncbi:hypothetical protein D3C77_615180 [compost metagenome]